MVIFQNAKLWLRDIFLLDCSSPVHFKSFELYLWSWSKYRLTLPMAVYRNKKYWTENSWRSLEILWLCDNIEMRFSCIMCSQADSMSGYCVMTFFFGYVALETIVCQYVKRLSCKGFLIWYTSIFKFGEIVTAWPYG